MSNRRQNIRRCHGRALQRNFRVSSDEQLAAYLRQIATRLLKHMSPMELRLQFFLVDLPDANAFNLPGGRIYVSPKIWIWCKTKMSWRQS